MKSVLGREEISLDALSPSGKLVGLQQHFLPHGRFIITFCPMDSTTLYFVEFQPETREWTSPEVFFSFAETKAIGDSEIAGYTLFIDNTGILVLVVALTSTQTTGPPTGLYIVKSHNYGKTWGTPQDITPERQQWVPSGEAFLSEIGFNVGHIVVPVYHPVYARFFCLSSHDNAKSWNFSLFIEPTEEEAEMIESGGVLRPQGPNVGKIVELRNGYLTCFYKYAFSSAINWAYSQDFGNTWSEGQKLVHFPGTTEAPFDVKNSIDPAKMDQLTLFLGHTKRNSSYSLTLWAYDYKNHTFEEVWADQNQYAEGLENVHLSIDESHNIHILYKTGAHILYHTEIAL